MAGDGSAGPCDRSAGSRRRTGSGVSPPGQHRRQGATLRSEALSSSSPASGRRPTAALHPFRAALALAGVYVLLCSAYIMLSSARAAQLASSVVELQRFEQWKGVAFVAFTGLLFFGAAWLALQRLARQQEVLERQRALLAAAEGPVLAGSFAAAVAHDINNVLTVARGSVDALSRPEVGEERRARALALLTRAHEDLARINRRMVGLGDRSGGAERAPLDLGTLVHETVAFASRHAKIRDCRIRTEAPTPLPFDADRDLLQRAMLNLLLNAAEAMGGSGPIEVRLVREGDGIRLEVHDGGPGVEAERRDEIFHAFRTTKAGGTGLGLFSVWRTVEAHGGHVAVEDSPLGGACFRMVLPPAP